MVNHSHSVNIKVATWNGDGILHKKNEVGVFLEFHGISILLVSEIHLKPHQSFRLRGFNSVRKDHPAQRGVAECFTEAASRR